MASPSIRVCLALAMGWTLLSASVATAQEPEKDGDKKAEAKKQDALAAEAGTILRRYCSRCHRGKGSQSGYAFNVADVESLADEGMLVEGDHESAEIFQAMFTARMPPRNRPQLPRPSAEEVGKIKAWIDAGAAGIPPPKPRPPVTIKDELQAVHRDLLDLRRDARVRTVYFSLSHLHNDIEVNDDLLETNRDALAKALNSLSWAPQLVKPRAVNEAKTVFAVDLAEIRWTRAHWLAVAQAYPYALSYGSLDDLELDETDQSIRDLRRGDQTPYLVRGDWLAAVATKPPLYHALLYDLALPALRDRQADPNNAANPKRMADLDLERHLQVDVLKNILSGRAQRSGFTQSGVSGQNRLIERHPLGNGRYYWKSYDFKSSNRSAILSEFPLGPKFDGNKFDHLAFGAHDGGEIIFALPNGLQGYLLVDGAGNRIDAGPIEVVGDSLKTSGNEQIVTGLSCIACHRVGMIESPDDEVRRFSSALGDARREVRRLYPELDAFRKLVDQDRRGFLAAVRRLDDKPWESLPEAVGEVARQYHLEPMTLSTVAAGLQVPPDRLRKALENDPALQSLGLRVLLRESGSIKRAAWESPAAFPLMKQAARQFGYDPQ